MAKKKSLIPSARAWWWWPNEYIVDAVSGRPWASLDVSHPVLICRWNLGGQSASGYPRSTRDHSLAVEHAPHANCVPSCGLDAEGYIKYDMWCVKVPRNGFPNLSCEEPDFEALTQHLERARLRNFR